MNTQKYIKDFPGAGDQPMWIGGRSVMPDGAELIPIYNPATENVIGSVPEADRNSIEQAIDSARKTFDDGVWREKSAVERQNIMLRFADLIEANALKLARLETLNTGMVLPMAEIAIANCVQVVRFYAGMATKVYGQTANISGAHGRFQAYTIKEPVGVVALIVPWNVPAYLTLVKLAPALAAGCSCIVKPAIETPLTGLFIGRMAKDAGIPDGIINVITGGANAGEALVQSNKVDKIAFTGSSDVGKKIVSQAGGNLKKLTLELGGKSPVILFDDCDIDKAVQGIAQGIFTHAGQICVAGSRLYIEDNIYQQVVEKISALAGQIVIGDPFDSGVHVGPLISGKQRARVERLVGEGIAAGGEVTIGGNAPQGPGYFYSPTVISNPPETSTVVKEEIFGPVLVTLPFSSARDVLGRANATHYGLAASVWTNDLNKAHYFSSRLNAGMVWINCHGIADISLPAGGYKESGWGREQGLEGMEAYLQTKMVCASMSDQFLN